MSDIEKILCLTEELETAYKLIESGLGELQEIHMGNDFYHLPQQLLASGFERLLKCYFCLVREARDGQFPNAQFLRDLGHDLQKLKEALINDFFNANNRPLVQDDLEFLRNDNELGEIIRILSDFGKKARYYNLDVVTGSNNPPINPKEEWENLEKGVEDPLPYSSDLEKLYSEYYPRVNTKIIAKLERFCRAIAMQFTLGNHGGRLQQMSVFFTKFRNIRNEEFGTIEYRHSVENTKASWNPRSQSEALNSVWPSRLVSKDMFEGDWPFRFDEVVVECQEGMFYIANINGYDFALNGSANSRYDYPFPHDAGVAILGKSVGPFIEIASSLY